MNLLAYVHDLKKVLQKSHNIEFMVPLPFTLRDGFEKRGCQQELLSYFEQVCKVFSLLLENMKRLLRSQNGEVKYF